MEIPRRTWILAIAKADVAIRLVSGGRTARSAGLRAAAHNAAVAKYVVIAYVVDGSGLVFVILVFLTPDLGDVPDTCGQTGP